jgi:hypothetical protein
LYIFGGLFMLRITAFVSLQAILTSQIPTISAQKAAI